jgi:hypothetical protein
MVNHNARHALIRNNSMEIPLYAKSPRHHRADPDQLSPSKISGAWWQSKTRRLRLRNPSFTALVHTLSSRAESQEPERAERPAVQIIVVRTECDVQNLMQKEALLFVSRRRA